jgi:hypothetical protein
VKCINCGKDSKFSERPDRRCTCGQRFAFEPKDGDRFTDAGFKSAIDAVSSNGQVRWGVEHLYYELCRRLRKRMYPWGPVVVLCVFLMVPLAVLRLLPQGALLLPACLGAWWLLRRYGRPRLVKLDQAAFDGMWQRWVAVHGNPPGLIVRKRSPAVSRPQESDIGDYSFDRAVICDRARTVDLLLANNFHFENSCAVLSIGGYPQGPFETVRTMLKRNPKLHVFALHDASLPGCEMVHTLANDPLWFKGQAPVTDVGLRPRHAAPFLGLYLPRGSASDPGRGQGIGADERAWLDVYTLELAAIRPEQVLKRLFRAINRKEDSNADSGGSDSGGGSDWNVHYDESSFGSDAGDSDGGADSFG